MCSLLTRPRPEVVPGLVPVAAAWVWGDGETWRLSIDGQTQLVKPGDSWVLDGRTFRGAATSLVDSAHTATRLDAPAMFTCFRQAPGRAVPSCGGTSAGSPPWSLGRGAAGW